tara:strand:+ start:907 stop:1074 length:168 start_codon:yes stop_codon:yes gene_type:complete
MAKDKKEKKEELVEEKAPEEEPTPKPEKKPEGEIIYTANGPMLKLPDGSMVAVQD